MITNEEINDYIFCIRAKLAEYGYKVATYELLGKDTMYFEKTKLVLAEYYFEIMLDYFDNSHIDYFQFYDLDEIEQVMEHINRLLGSNCWLDLRDKTPDPSYKVSIRTLDTCGIFYADYDFDVFDDIDYNNTIVQWYTVDDPSGTNLYEIPGATSRIYNVDVAFKNRYLFYIVTPKDMDGNNIMSPIKSALISLANISADPPLLTRPINGAINQPLSSLLFEWDPVPEADAYRFELSDQSDFSNIIDTVDTVNTSYTLSITLLPVITYYWRVYSMCNDTIGVTPPVSSFETECNNVAVPTITFPDVPNYSQESTDIMLSWTSVSGANGYEIEIRENSGSGPIYMTDITSYTNYNINGIPRDKVYFYRVRTVWRPGCTSAWSNFVSFAITSVIPVQVSPADGVTNVDRHTTFTWQASDSTAVNYHLQYSKTSDFSSGVYTRNIAAPTTSYTVSTDLDETETYYWHILAEGSNTNTDYSPTWSFTTGS